MGDIVFYEAWNGHDDAVDSFVFREVLFVDELAKGSDIVILVFWGFEAKFFTWLSFAVKGGDKCFGSACVDSYKHNASLAC